MVHAYAERKTTPEVIQAVLGVTPETFDKQYLQWIDGRYGTMATNFDQSRHAMEEMVAKAKSKDYDAVIQQGEIVRRLYPEYVGPANPYEFIASADLSKGDKKGAVSVLTAYEKTGGDDPSTLKQLAALEEELGSPGMLPPRSIASTISTRSRTKRCTGIWGISGLRKRTIPGPFGNMPP